MRDGEGGACYEWRGVWWCVEVCLVLFPPIPFVVFAVTALLV
nr:MAG TPA: Stage II sporulation protein [Caudoviricetes sp.]